MPIFKLSAPKTMRLLSVGTCESFFRSNRISNRIGRIPR